MKLNFRFVALALGGSLAVLAAEPAKPSCCVEEKPATPPCCVEVKPAAPACCSELKTASVDAPAFTARSLYQLDARWTNDRGEQVTLAALRGRPVVIAMFFATCEYACPMLLVDLQRVRAALPPQTREQTQFVLVTFDPARDTVEALRAYRASRGLDASWSLLRGDDNAIQDLAMLLGVKYKQDARGQFSHSNLFTVLNAEGEITFQRSGLEGDPLEPAKAVVQVAKK